MIMLSSTAEYALRAALHLAQREGDGPMRVDDIAAALDVPRNYLSKVLHALVKRGLLRSVRGPHGGFELAEPAASLTLDRVVSVFDEVGRGSGCVLGEDGCPRGSECPVHARWEAAAGGLVEFFRRTCVRDLVAERTAERGPRTEVEG